MIFYLPKKRILRKGRSFGWVFVEAKNDLALNTRIKSLGFIFDADSLAIEV